MWKCPQCGSENEDVAVKCLHCRRLAEEAASADLRRLAKGESEPSANPPPTRLPRPQAETTVGTFLKQLFFVWTQNLPGVLAVMVALRLPVLPLDLWSASVTAARSRAAGSGLLDLLATFLTIVVSLFLGATASGLFARSALRTLQGGQVTLGEFLGSAGQSFWVSLVTAADVTWRIAVWGLCLYVPGLVAFFRLYLAVPSRIAEPQLGSHTAVARSDALTDGRRGMLFGALLLLSLLESAVTMAIHWSTGWRLSVIPGIQTVMLWAVTTVASSLYWVGASVAYHDLRLEKEGPEMARLAEVFE